MSRREKRIRKSLDFGSHQMLELRGPVSLFKKIILPSSHSGTGVNRIRKKMIALAYNQKGSSFKKQRRSIKVDTIKAQTDRLSCGYDQDQLEQQDSLGLVIKYKNPPKSALHKKREIDKTGKKETFLLNKKSNKNSGNKSLSKRESSERKPQRVTESAPKDRHLKNKIFTKYKNMHIKKDKIYNEERCA
ncbi:unnamed protein product [Moneuplotes crassus]|uniref:Uncharacterized protein n=1 Tax=Euplotes crassus TaxID=5936 RepID=A0AAD1XDH1_EUPCR|nr:unnamed protein product [Moneuplotes crassus]